MLDALFGKDIDVSGASEMDLFVPSIRGLENADAELVGVIGGDHSFVNAAGAAVAEMPPVEPGTEDALTKTQLLDQYGEVAAVLSRLVNEFGGEPVQVVPNATYASSDLGLIIGAAERCLFTLEIDGYGAGVAGIWTCI